MFRTTHKAQKVLNAGRTIVGGRVALGLDMGQKVFLAASVLIAALIPFLAGLAQAQTAPQSFEVASIRRSTAKGLDGGPAAGRVTIGRDAFARRVSGRRMVQTLATVSDLVMDAYEVERDQVVGAPAWAAFSGDPYDIEALIPNGTFTLDEVRVMLQNLLAERFQLRVHKQLVESPVYVLKVAAGGPKFKAQPEGNPFNTVDLLSTRLGFMLPEPLLNETGLTGVFDWKLDYPTLSRELQEGLFPPPSIFGIVEQDLGLKLERTKRQRERIVIDRVERPSEN
jgi:hypothetical protein